MERIVNVHIPKCAGTSFKIALAASFKVKYDYGGRISRSEKLVISDSIAQNYQIDAAQYDAVNCISGHFIPIKYLKLHQAGWKFITWLRDPAQRLFSQYYHYQRHKELFLNQGVNNSPGFYVLSRNLTVEAFVLDPLFKNHIRRFFYRFPPRLYFFIGIVEQYPSDLAFLSEQLGVNIPLYWENLNLEKQNEQYDIPSALLAEIKQFHSQDYQIYEQVTQQSKQRK